MSSPDLWTRITQARLGRVLLFYAGASWAVLEATDFFIARFGLPDWFLPAALVLLLIGLVVFTGTALVQTQLARPAAGGVEPAPGQQATSKHGALLRKPSGLGRLLTWRNALMGGVFAFAFWGVAAAGWMLLSGAGRAGAAGSAAGGLAAEVKKLVVLPFENLSGEQDDYFAAGVTDAITARLATLSGLGIISRQSASQYKNSDKTAQQIGAELGVGFILEGTVQRERPNDPTSRVRVIPQLVRISDDTHLWAATYDKDMAEVFRVQSEIAERVAQALDVALLEPGRASLETKPSDNLEAYDYFLRGNDYYNRGSLGYLERAPLTAAGLYQKAVELDPGFALAWAALSRAHTRVYLDGFDADAARLDRAHQAAQRALELAPQLPEGHLALGEYYMERRDDRRAMEEFERARAANPNDAELLLSIAVVLTRQDKIAETLPILERAVELDPRSVTPLATFALSLARSGRNAEAEGYLDRAIALAPNEIAPYAYKISYYLDVLGDPEAARRVVREGSARMGEMNFAANLLSWNHLYYRVLPGELDGRLQRLSTASFAHDTVSYYFYYLARGWRQRREGQLEVARAYYDSARVLLEGRAARSPDNDNTQRALALAFAGLGRNNEAIEAARRALELVPPSQDADEGNEGALLLAQVRTMLGQEDEALEVLGSLIERAPRHRARLRVDPAWDPLRADPRFQALLGAGS